MQDWEVLAMEERTIRESIAERAADLEEQVASHREAHERAASERDSQSLTVDGLQRALQDIQDGKSQRSRETPNPDNCCSSKTGITRACRKLTGTG